MLPDADDGDHGDLTRSTLLAAQAFLAKEQRYLAAQASLASQTSLEAQAPFRSRLEFLMTGIVPVTDTQDADCTICTVALTADVVKLVRCGHFFHCRCILAWLHTCLASRSRVGEFRSVLCVGTCCSSVSRGHVNGHLGFPTYTYSSDYGIAALAEIRYRLTFGGPATLPLPVVDE